MLTIVGCWLPLLVSVMFGIEILACSRENRKVNTISQESLLSQIDAKKPLLILDVRTKKEYDAGHIPEGINIDFN